MIKVVLDTNTVVSAIFWPQSIARRCLAGLARRQYALAATDDVFIEYEAVIREFAARFPERNALGVLAWLRLKAVRVEPLPLGKQRSRDFKDDIFLSCALAANAKYVVSRDQDLLVLEKPFGVKIITPMEFLRWLHEHAR